MWSLLNIQYMLTPVSYSWRPNSRVFYSSQQYKKIKYDITISKLGWSQMKHVVLISLVTIVQCKKQMLKWVNKMKYFMHFTQKKKPTSTLNSKSLIFTFISRTNINWCPFQEVSDQFYIVKYYRKIVSLIK